MGNTNRQQTSEGKVLSDTFLSRPFISYRIPVKKKMQNNFEYLQSRKQFKTGYPFAKGDDWELPKLNDPSFKNYVLLFFLITVLFPLLLLFMPLGILLDYKYHLKSNKNLRNKFAEDKAKYLNGEQ